MTDSKQRLLDMLTEIGLGEPYNPKRLAGIETDIQGWGSDDPIFEYVIRHWRPHVIVEVGTWKGASAIKMADIQKSLGIDGLILCVDTWLGSNESLWRVAENRASLRLEDGYPTMFRQFLVNVVASGHVDRVRHLPMTSTSAAELLEVYGIVVDGCYIDAGHLETEVYNDVHAYWRLLKPGGVLFGDDYFEAWPGTIKAVNRFAAETGVKLRTTEAKWMMVKPS